MAADCRKKLLTLGDPGVGKTCLLWSHSKKEFPVRYIPRFFEACLRDFDIGNGRFCELALWDTAPGRPGEDPQDWDRFMPLAYPNTDIVILCFSLADIKTLHNIEEKWYAELNHHCPDVPIILLGTKLDLREDEEYASTNDGRCVTMAEGLRMKAKNANVVKYMECSAITRYGVDEVFNEAARIACLKEEQERTKKCLIS